MVETVETKVTGLDEMRRSYARVLVIFLWVNVLAVMAIAWGSDNVSPVLVSAAALLMGAASTAVWMKEGTGVPVRIVTAVSLAGLVSLLVAAMGGGDPAHSFQIDAHMYFFAALAILAGWVDWRALVAFSAVVAVHHLFFNFMMPLMVFPDGGNFLRVVLHAGIVVMETAALIWLTARIQDRRERIRLGLPNALDFLQISIEAGLGFDAAILRVSRELSTTAPDIAQEFMMMELEIQAGKDRDAAFLEMADRCDIDEMKSFANVILQATHFGSSVATALTTYAKGLRQDRELRAQEKANRLPVQMSAVIALCMMPVLLMICLGPMLIRWITVFG